MNAIKIEEISYKNRHRLKHFFEGNKYSPYSALRLYTDAGKLTPYYYEQVFSNKRIRILSAVKRDTIVGLLIYYISDWDSKIFKIKMANIEVIMAAGGYSSELMIKNKLLKELISRAKDMKIKHLSIRVDMRDLSSAHALELNGFRIIDSLFTYILKNRLINIPSMKNMFNIRKILREDIKEAGDLFADRYVTGHYSVDPRIPSNKAKNMYRMWLENKFKDHVNNDIFIAERSGKIVGCSMFSFDNLLKKYTGLNSVHRGLVAVEPSAAGCLVAFIKAQIEKRKNLDFAEFETQGHNYRMLQAMQKLGMQITRSRYTFHKVIA